MQPIVETFHTFATLAQFSSSDKADQLRDIAKSESYTFLDLKQTQYCRIHLDFLHLHCRDGSRTSRDGGGGALFPDLDRVEV
jgi:hypothetical protein